MLVSSWFRTEFAEPWQLAAHLSRAAFVSVVYKQGIQGKKYFFVRKNFLCALGVNVDAATAISDIPWIIYSSIPVFNFVDIIHILFPLIIKTAPICFTFLLWLALRMLLAPYFLRTSLEYLLMKLTPRSMCFNQIRQRESPVHVLNMWSSYNCDGHSGQGCVILWVYTVGRVLNSTEIFLNNEEYRVE